MHSYRRIMQRRQWKLRQVNQLSKVMQQVSVESGFEQKLIQEPRFIATWWFYLPKYWCTVETVQGQLQTTAIKNMIFTLLVKVLAFNM